MRRSQIFSSLNYQNLEDRKLLAGDVTVVENGNLFIRGDELSNQFAIIADEDGRITVTGRSGTTINGSSEAFQVSDAFDLNGIRGRQASFEGGLRIKTFDGHDRIDIQGIELGGLSHIETGEGDDFVRFLKSTSKHDFAAVTGDGDDTLNFVQTRVHGDFNVATTEGHDSIRVRNSRTWGSTDLFSGAGDDTVTLDRVRLTGDQHRVITHDGDDHITVRDNNVNEAGLDIFAGDGRDQVFAEMNTSNEVDGEVVIAGQDGFDVLHVDGDEDMIEEVNDSGFVSGEDAEGAFYAYNRGDAVETPQFVYWATAVDFDETTRVRSIDWLGSYHGSEASASDNFVIEIFESEAIESLGGGYWFQQPVAVASASYNIGNDANRIDTGQEWSETIYEPDDLESDSGVRRKIFSYSAEIDFEFLADTTYWVSIYTITDIETSDFEAHYVRDDDFAMLLDYPGEPGELREYVQPSGTQADPFPNTNAVQFDDNIELGIDPTRWYFSSSDIKTLLALNP